VARAVLDGGSPPTRKPSHVELPPHLDLHVLDSVTAAPRQGQLWLVVVEQRAAVDADRPSRARFKDLSKQPAPSSALRGTNLMLFALLAMNRPAAQTNVVYVRRHGTW